MKRFQQSTVEDTTPSRTIQCYEVKGWLGKGAFSSCYEVYSPTSGYTYACKILKKKKIRDMDLVLNEIEIHRLLKHPGIVTLSSFFEDNTKVYLLQELCGTGSTLQDLFETTERLPPEQMDLYLQQIVSALQYLHSLHIIHRDIKTNNLLIKNEKQILLGDFGLALQLTKEKPFALSRCGTPNYVAPEILKREPYTYPVDIWSLGVVIYMYWSKGTGPFEGKTVEGTYQRILEEPWTPLVESSRATNLLLDQFFQKDPSQRGSLTLLSTSSLITSTFQKDEEE